MSKYKKDFLNIAYHSGEPIPFKLTRFESQQLYVSQLMSPDHQVDTMFLIHIPGSGKTNTSLRAAFSYLKLFRLFPLQDYNVIIIGFQKSTFLNEIMSRPDLGYISDYDFSKLEVLGTNRETEAGEEQYNKFYNYVKNKITNLAFYGYQELFNMLFPGGDKNSPVNEDTLKLFEKAYVICDEIHNVYNSVETNNYGEALKYIFKWHAELELPDKFLKKIFMSATFINNNPTEMIDVLNLIDPLKNYTTTDFFTPEGLLKPGGLGRIKKAAEGRFSFYANNDPKFFPTTEFEGERIPGIDYLRFILCPISPKHLQEYKKLDTLPIDCHGILDGVFPIGPKDLYGYKTRDFDTIQLQEDSWRAKTGISISNGTITGTIFKRENLKQWSSKLYTMITDLIENTKHNSGKVIIMHEYVNGPGGIKSIEQTLLMNGFIPEMGGPTNTTICAICAQTQENHRSKHEYSPARYVLVTGEVSKKNIKTSIAKFNAFDNQGQSIKVLLGSEVIKEGYNFLGVEHFWIMCVPSSVSAFLQTLGRPVRKNSHLMLPPERQHVCFRIYITDTPKEVKNFEKLKYARRMKNYSIIREIERAVREVAVDNHIYYDLISKSFVQPNEIGILKYPRSQSKDLGIKILPEDKISFEIDEMRTLIIAHFYKTPVWRYSDLWKAVRDPVFVHYVDTKQFSEDNFIQALGDILYSDSRIIMNSELYTIVESGEFLIMYPIVSTCDPTPLGCLKQNLDGSPIITPTSWIDLPIKTEIYTFDITDSLLNLNTNYEEMKLKFHKKFHNVDILGIPKSTEIYGNNFHRRLIEESIGYIFNVLTGQSERSEYHELYFKMVNFYSKIDLIIYANNIAPEQIPVYKQYISGEVNTNTLLMPKTQTSSLSSFEMSEIEKFIKRKHKKVPANILPVGHFLTKNNKQRFYTPQGWFDSTLYKAEENSIENDIIIGYYDRTEDSIEFKFKLRSPVHKMKKESDIRLQEKGVVCETRKKSYLQEIAKELGVTPFGTNHELCEIIKQDLLHRELKERNRYRKGITTKRVRWCYLQTEI